MFSLRFRVQSLGQSRPSRKRVQGFGRSSGVSSKTLKPESHLKRKGARCPRSPFLASPKVHRVSRPVVSEVDLRSLVLGHEDLTLGLFDAWNALPQVILSADAPYGHSAESQAINRTA